MSNYSADNYSDPSDSHYLKTTIILLKELIIEVKKLTEINKHVYSLLYQSIYGIQEDSKVECPKCNKIVEPDALGYCSDCKFDLKAHYNKMEEDNG